MSEKPLDGISVVTQNTEARLNPRQLEDYRQQREACLRWLLSFGLDPSEVDEYDVAFYTTQLIRACESIVSSLGWDRGRIGRHLRSYRDVGLAAFERRE